MSKQLEIIGNDGIVITEDREVISKITGEPLKTTNGKIVIGLFGKHKEVTVEWLYWYAVYRLPIPIKYRDRVFDLCFKDHGLLKHMTKDPKIVVFKKPVFVDYYKKYAMIARYPKYAISKTGHVRKVKDIIYNDMKLSKNIKNRKNISINYKMISLSINDDPFYKNNSIHVVIHRLVALTWHENICDIDFVKTPLVNHIDGNKRNCNINNLEFVSYSGNNNHAVASGLRNDNFFITIRNIDTGEIKEFSSLTLAVEYIGRSRINTQYTPLEYGRVWRGKRGRFEIYRVDKFKGWYYENRKPEKKENKSINNISITVHHKDGDKTYPSISKFCKDELMLNSSKTIKDSIKIFKNRYPDIKLTVKINDTTNKTIEARNIKTKKIIKSFNIKDIANKIGVSHSHVKKMLDLNDDCRVYKDWQIRYMTTDKWCEEFNISSNHSKQISIIDTDTGKEIITNSLREAGKILSKDRKTVKKAIDKKIKINNYIITYK